MDIVYIIGIFLAFFISVLLFTKNGKTLPDKILAVWMSITGIQLLYYYLYTQGLWEQYPHLIGLASPFPFFHGPMLYLYTLFSLKEEKRLRKIDYLHFLPILLSYAYMIDFIFFFTVEQKKLVDIGGLDKFDTFINLSLIGFVISIVVYPILSYRLLIRYKKMVEANFSYNEGINLRWLKNIILGFCAVILMALIVLILRMIVGFQFSFLADNLFYGLAIILIIVFGYNGIRQQDLFSCKIGNEPIIEPKSEYKKSGLKPEIAEKFHKRLLETMRKEKPYLNSKLSLGKLSLLINVSSNHLSQVINQYEKMNFHDFINKYRVEEFKKLAKESPHYSILALAFEAGFNSKSSFNSNFKNHTGETPSHYISNN